MKSLNTRDLKYTVSKVPSRLIEAFKELTDSYVIAGGFIRSIIAKEPINDIDIFTTSKESAETLVEKIHANAYKTDNAFSFTLQGRKVQIIHRWMFTKPEDIIDHFDFTIAQAALWFDSGDCWNSLCSDSFYEDLASKRLIYTYPPDAEPGGSLLRLLKFRARNYSPNLHSIAGIISRLTSADEREIIRALKEVDPSSVDWDEDTNEHKDNAAIEAE